MAHFPRTREQHIAVFGESGSGKTVLLSTFFGPALEGRHSNDLWDLVADDTGQGNRLYQNYLGMRDRATTPPATRFASTTYNFSVKLKGGLNDASKKQPFDVIRLAWHDYPGEWFEESPSSEEEHARRLGTFESLLRSDVALLLVDGQKLLDYQGEEERYLKSLLTNFRQGILRLKDDLLADGTPLVEFPRIWILALSKADLFPGWTVDKFRDVVIGSAADHVEALRATLKELVEAPDAFAMGEDFLLLSSAKFELSSDLSAPTEIDVTKRLGVDLILPIASLLPLERRVQWSERIDVPARVLESLADGAEMIATVLNDEKLAFFQHVVSRMGGYGRSVAAALPTLRKAAELAGPHLRDLNEQARAKNDYLRATLTQFKLDLEDGMERKLLRTPK